MLLKGKTALVTGGAAGIGAEICRLLAEEGAHVFVLDRQTGVDVRSPSQIQKVVDEAIGRHGRIDILINNAGIYPRQDFVSMTEQQWDDIQDVDLKGVFHCSKAVVARMIAQGSGKIVNISSVTFLRGAPKLVHYVARKRS